MKMLKMISLGFTILALNGCQLISPVFVEYNGVRRDVAQWINHHSFMSMQQKRSLAQLSRAQQKLVNIEKIDDQEKLAIAHENSVAMHCANQHLSAKQIAQLQSQVFGEQEKIGILNYYDQHFPKLKLDATQIQCD
jgi:hypothetical protein